MHTGLDTIVAGKKGPYQIVKYVTACEAAGRHHSLWRAPGIPNQGNIPSSGMSGNVCDSSSVGALTFLNTALDEQIISMISASNGVVAGALIVIDRLWEQSGIVVTTTTAQTINSITFPARDDTATTNGAGVQIALEVYTATTNAGTTLPTITYTNSANVGSRVATMPQTFPATAVAGTFCPFIYNPGDSGVRSVQSINLNTSLVTGAVGLVAYRVLAVFDVPTQGTLRDALQLGMPKVWNNSCLQLIWMPTTTSGFMLTGTYGYSEA